jgi:NAD(P)-dependent dehydrogenase (short-subunit alcohol dehydrogenase family)
MAPTREDIERKSALLSEEMFDSYVASDDKFHSLNEKLIAITGTTSGLGFHIARCAIAKGARTVLLLNRESSRSTEALAKLQAIADKAADNKTDLVAVACDLQDMESVKKAAAEVNSIAETHGGLDGKTMNALFLCLVPCECECAY